MACPGPTCSGLPAVQDVVLRPDARWLPLIREGKCFDLKVVPPEEWQPAQALRHASVAVPRDMLIAPVTDQARLSATSATSASAATPYIINVSKCVASGWAFIELKFTTSSELFTWFARRRAGGCSSFVLAGNV